MHRPASRPSAFRGPSLSGMTGTASLTMPGGYATAPYRSAPTAAGRATSPGETYVVAPAQLRGVRRRAGPRRGHDPQTGGLAACAHRPCRCRALSSRPEPARRAVRPGSRRRATAPPCRSRERGWGEARMTDTANGEQLRSVRAPLCFERPPVHPLAQRRARPEVRCVPRGKRHRGPRSWIAPDPSSTKVQREAAEAPNLDTPAVGEACRHVFEHHLHRKLHVAPGEQRVLVRNALDQFRPRHRSIVPCSSPSRPTHPFTGQWRAPRGSRPDRATVPIHACRTAQSTPRTPPLVVALPPSGRCPPPNTAAPEWSRLPPRRSTLRAPRRWATLRR